jgi:hypothetical protein
MDCHLRVITEKRREEKRREGDPKRRLLVKRMVKTPNHRAALGSWGDSAPRGHFVNETRSI